MPDLKVRVSRKHRSLVDRRVASGEFASADAYVEQLLDRDAQRVRRTAVEQQLLGRLNRESAIEMDARDFASLKRRYIAAINKVNKSE